MSFPASFCQFFNRLSSKSCCSPPGSAKHAIMNLRLPLFSLTFTLVARILALRSGVDYNGSSAICESAYSIKETRYVPYTETYVKRKLGIKYGTGVRTNYKTEYITSYKKVEKCCAGYELVDDDICMPKCDPPCHNSDCVLPQVCRCKDGYARADNTEHVCRPICDNDCLNGVCDSPNHCECQLGFKLTTTNNYTCLPHCEHDCKAGNAFCASPNTCMCLPGFKMIPEAQKKSPTDICGIICEQPCVNGKCVGIDVCKCNSGFEPNPDNIFLCNPKCSKKCVNSECTAPETCTCLPNYKKGLLPNVCEPICDPPCHNGKCVAPNACTCNDGYELTVNSTCKPFCQKPCVNGHCIDPDVCQCESGHRLIDKYICEPSCHQICENGNCTAPNVCTCSFGFEYNNHTTNCEPVCDECMNGYCKAPGLCQCLEGYVYSNNLTTVCEAKCPDTCKSTNGSCEQPHVCKCPKGYSLHDNNSTCHPECEVNCENGFCSEPNVCSCNEGFVRDDQGLCRQECIDCGSTKCEDGFKFDESTKSCRSECELCQGDECSLLETCKCSDGLERHANGSCVVRDSCASDCNSHGACNQEGLGCICNFGWSGASCDALTFCSVEVARETTTFLSLPSWSNVSADEWTGPPCSDKCFGQLDNESLCYQYNSSDFNVICFLNINSTCNAVNLGSQIPHRSAATGVIFAALFCIIFAAAAALMYYIRQRKSTIQVQPGQVDNEREIAQSLINEELYTLRDLDDNNYNNLN